MGRRGRLMVSIITSLGFYLLSAGGAYDSLQGRIISSLEDARMKNVVVSGMASPERAQTIALHTGVVTESALPTVKPAEQTMNPVAEKPDETQILATTIEGGMTIRNETDYFVDAADILKTGSSLRLKADEPQILIIHTHSSEAYTQSGFDRYEPSDSLRTEDTQFNVVRIGDELTDILTAAGLNVIHDRGIYDYPSYTGSYTRTGEAIEQYLREYPSIAIVFDIHRDALGTDGVVYKTMAEEEGVCSSQVMLLVGTDNSGLEHPNWRQNLSLALYLQNAVNLRNPTLMRPVCLVKQRYNQHLTQGSLIIEVGSSGNTLPEALTAISLFGNAAADALLELVE